MFGLLQHCFPLKCEKINSITRGNNEVVVHGEAKESHNIQRNSALEKTKIG